MWKRWSCNRWWRPRQVEAAGMEGSLVVEIIEKKEKTRESHSKGDGKPSTEVDTTGGEGRLSDLDSLLVKFGGYFSGWCLMYVSI